MRWCRFSGRAEQEGVGSRGVSSAPAQIQSPSLAMVSVAEGQSSVPTVSPELICGQEYLGPVLTLGTPDHYKWQDNSDCGHGNRVFPRTALVMISVDLSLWCILLLREQLCVNIQVGHSLLEDKIQLCEAEPLSSPPQAWGRHRLLHPSEPRAGGAARPRPGSQSAECSSAEVATGGLLLRLNCTTVIFCKMHHKTYPCLILAWESYSSLTGCRMPALGNHLNLYFSWSSASQLHRLLINIS